MYFESPVAFATDVVKDYIRHHPNSVNTTGVDSAIDVPRGRSLSRGPAKRVRSRSRAPSVASEKSMGLSSRFKSRSRSSSRTTVKRKPKVVKKLQVVKYSNARHLGAFGNAAKHSHGLRATFDDFKSFSLACASNQRNFVDAYMYNNNSIGRSGINTTSSGTFGTGTIITDFTQGQFNTGFGSDQTPFVASGVLSHSIFSPPIQQGQTWNPTTGVSSGAPPGVVTLQTNAGINNTECLIYDCVEHNLYFANGGSTTAEVKIEIFECMDSQNTALSQQIDNQYLSQEWYRQPGTQGTVAGAVTQQSIAFDATKVPGLKKFWKRVKLDYIRLELGVEEHYTWVDENVVFDQQKWLLGVNGALPNYMKGISKVLRVSLRGGLARIPQSDATANGITCAFSKADIGIMWHRRVTGHRRSLFAEDKKPVSIVPYYGAFGQSKQIIGMPIDYALDEPTNTTEMPQTNVSGSATAIPVATIP